MNIKDRLKTAWNKVRDFLNNEDHDHSVFYLSRDEAKTLRADYSLFQKHIFMVNRYAAGACHSVPTCNYKISHLDGSALSAEQITALEEKLTQMRSFQNSASHNPRLDA